MTRPSSSNENSGGDSGIRPTASLPSRNSTSSLRVDYLGELEKFYK